MNTALDAPRVYRQCSMEPLVERCCAAGCQRCNCGPANPARTPTRDTGIVSGSNFEGWHATSAAAFTGFGARNRHRPRD